MNVYKKSTPKRLFKHLNKRFNKFENCLFIMDNQSNELKKIHELGKQNSQIKSKVEILSD